MTEQLAAHRASRNIALKRLKEIVQFAQDAIADPTLHTQLKIRCSKLDHIFNDFEQSHNAIVAAISSDPNMLDQEDLIRTEADEHYYTVSSVNHDIQKWIEANKEGLIFSQNTRNCKLPKLQLPCFDGDFKSWPHFYGLFTTLVHTNDQLSNIEKFEYLITNLAKEPLNIVQGVTLAAENYEIAFQTLVDRYQDKKLLATFYWNQIRDAPKATETVHSLRKLVNIFTENVSALRALNFPVDSWDFPLFNILFDKLDLGTKTRFELKSCSEKVEIPSYVSLKQFLTEQCKALESVGYSVQASASKISSFKPNDWFSKNYNKKSSVTTSLISNKVDSSTNSHCPLCKNNHVINKCSQFLNKPPHSRHLLAKQYKLCLNCLRTHPNQPCPSSSCRLCNKRHHTLLHFGSNNITPEAESFSVATEHASIASPQQAELPPTPEVNTALTSNCDTSIFPSTVLLSTAQIDIVDVHGDTQSARALLDTGSQTNFITEKCLKRLGLNRSRLRTTIQGIGQVPSMSNGRTSCTIRPKGLDEPSYHFEAIVLPNICTNMPQHTISKSKISFITNLKLADEEFNVNGEVDILLGADLFPLILKEGKLTGNVNEPIALNTVFGWVLMGKIDSGYPSTVSSYLSVTHSSLDETLRRFWEIEEPPKPEFATQDDQVCEQIYRDTVTRDDSGRYVVSLPFKVHNPQIGDSRSAALRRFYYLERKLSKNPELKQEYSDFMKDFVDSGHMSPAVPLTDTNSSYFIPHHCVQKPDAVSTKLRVVFDASAKSDLGVSLNDVLFTGPKLQNDIATLLLSFRVYKFVFTADVRQMFRQILLTPSQRNYQRIIWRFAQADPIQEFTLNTVVYGISSSPYLANRTIRQLAVDEKQNFPLAAQALQSDVYVDDIISGENDLRKAIQLQNELVSCLERGGFQLRKWASNSPSLLGNVPEDYRQMPLSFDHDSIIKILGLQWNPHLDSFSYHANPFDRHCTKRTVLSELSRIFDPLGFLAPVIFFAKRLIQHIWTLGLDWDATPPDEVINLWSRYQSELPNLSSIQIPRRIVPDQYNCCQIHGFCDASQKGYAAMVYFRFELQNSYKVCISISKTRVAPLRQISIPRLELCAATLLARLVSYVCKTYQKVLTFSDIFCWSDSQTVIQWIKSSSHGYKTFVANRISLIQEKTSPLSWRFVPGEDNPADCASRGLLPSELSKHNLWWEGPPWLHQSHEYWPSSDMLKGIYVTGEEKTVTLTTTVEENVLDYIIGRLSSLIKIKRQVAWVLRFIHNSRKLEKTTGSLSLNEIQHAFHILIKHVQYTHFKDDILKVSTKSVCSKPLRRLSPFIDEHGILRVGGRLVNSKLSFDAKFPILLPQKHRLTQLIIEHFHQENLHPGPRTLEYLLLQQFWILSVKRAIRHIISRCFRCFRVSPSSSVPMMGNLPSLRVNQLKPFSCVGVDYGGPFSITLGKSRGCKSQKAYLCLFVCSSTKALHLELASDLSSEAFLAAFRRFIARRGRCSTIFSDNGTNFVGAHRYLLELMKNSAETLNLNWHFNPPTGSNFGGLFEAGIKSVKSHLLRVIGDQILTYEELNTVLVQIEALLNSRPMTSLSTDPNELTALTPGHFLTMEPLTALPDPDLSHLNMNRLSRWQLLQRLHQHFWKRWHLEYLNTLNQRQKWHTNTVSIAEGTLVIIKNDQTPPLKWILGRVVKAHTGSDNVCRVVTLRTAKGILQRPVAKICPLPSQ